LAVFRVGHGLFGFSDSTHFTRLTNSAVQRLCQRTPVSAAQHRFLFNVHSRQLDFGAARATATHKWVLSPLLALAYFDVLIDSPIPRQCPLFAALVGAAQSLLDEAYSLQVRKSIAQSALELATSVLQTMPLATSLDPQFTVPMQSLASALGSAAKPSVALVSSHAVSRRETVLSSEYLRNVSTEQYISTETEPLSRSFLTSAMLEPGDLQGAAHLTSLSSAASVGSSSAVADLTRAARDKTARLASVRTALDCVLKSGNPQFQAPLSNAVAFTVSTASRTYCIITIFLCSRVH
jgi:hypothetical protein